MVLYILHNITFAIFCIRMYSSSATFKFSFRTLPILHITAFILAIQMIHILKTVNENVFSSLTFYRGCHNGLNIIYKIANINCIKESKDTFPYMKLNEWQFFSWQFSPWQFSHNGNFPNMAVFPMFSQWQFSHCQFSHWQLS